MDRPVSVRALVKALLSLDAFDSDRSESAEHENKKIMAQRTSEPKLDTRAPC
jgi:uncharacterized protein (UPF0212 family)